MLYIKHAAIVANKATAQSSQTKDRVATGASKVNVKATSTLLRKSNHSLICCLSSAPPQPQSIVLRPLNKLMPIPNMYMVSSSTLSIAAMPVSIGIKSAMPVPISSTGIKMENKGSKGEGRI